MEFAPPATEAWKAMTPSEKEKYIEKIDKYWDLYLSYGPSEVEDHNIAPRDISIPQYNEWREYVNSKPAKWRNKKIYNFSRRQRKLEKKNAAMDDKRKPKNEEVPSKQEFTQNMKHNPFVV